MPDIYLMKTTIDRKRHILKAFTWRAIASITTFIIGWSVTGDMKLGMIVGAFDVVLKLVLYYAHERVWYKSKFGIETDSHMHMPLLTKESNVCTICGKIHEGF